MAEKQGTSRLKVSNLSGFDTRCCRVVRLPRHCTSCHSLLIYGLRIALHLSQSGVTGNGRNLIHATPCFSKAPTCSLAQPVKATLIRESGGLAPHTKLAAEIISGIRLACSSDEQRQVLAGCGVDDGAQVRMYRNAQFGSGLLLLNLRSSAA